MIATLEPLKPGLAGPFDQTLPKAFAAVEQAVNDPFMQVRSQAERIVLSSGETRPSRVLQAQAIFGWQVEHCGYLEDPSGWQLLKGPWQMLREIRERGHAMAACLSHACLFVSLGVSLGMPMGFVLCAPADYPNDLQHIYAALATGYGTSEDDLLPCDTGTREPRFGVHTLIAGAPTSRTFLPAYQET